MNIIEYKKDITGKVFISDENIPIVDYVILREDELVRIDKLSKRIYGNGDEYEKILKLNNIQNPFTISQDNLFNVVTDDYLKKIFVSPKELLLSPKILSVSEILNQNEISKVDVKRQERISKILYKFGEVPTELRKPIYLKTDERNLNIENGIIKI